MDSAKHQKAVTTFYRHEAVTLIDFRTALDVVADIANSQFVDATFYCQRDVEKLRAAADSIESQIKSAQQGIREFQKSEIGPIFSTVFAPPSDVAMSIFPLEEYAPNNG